LNGEYTKVSRTICILVIRELSMTKTQVVYSPFNHQTPLLALEYLIGFFLSRVENISGESEGWELQ